LVERGYPAFAETLLAERRQFGLPPFASLALLRAEAPHEADAGAFLRSAKLVLPPAVGVEALGPAPATMARRAGHHRSQLLLQSASRAALHRCIAAWLPQVETLAEARRVRWSLDIDPADLH
jgi:primosomal protein N' (replication factor Y)